MLRPNHNHSDSNDNINQEETIIPTFNKDPPISLEEALFLASGDPDTYANRGLYFIANAISMIGFSIYLSTMFLFQEPKVQCYNSELNIYFRCSVTQACTSYRDNYVINYEDSISSFIT